MSICLVLGAGASLANALHFRAERFRDTRPPLDTTFFETVEARGIALSTPLRTYLRSILGVEPTVTALRELRMEEVFADAFFDLQERPDEETTRDAYIDLVDLYLRVLRETTGWLSADTRRGGPVGKLIASAADRADELTIITFNHDLVIENEIQRRARLRGRWCLDHGYGAVSDSLIRTSPVGSVAEFQLHRDGECDHTRQITLLKLHGSLNWVVRLSSTRPTANFLRGQAGHRNVYLLTRRRIVEGRNQIVRSGKGRSTWDTWPVVVPPVYAKQALRAAVQLSWDDARIALETADRVIFFGYSLPGIDIEAEKLFERSLAANNSLPWIDVINPSPASASRFAGVGRTLPVRWYPDLRKLQW